MRKRAILLVLMLFFTSGACFAWHVNTHLQMTRDAISLMPPELQKLFTDHQKLVEAGIKEPDELLKDWQNHYYIPSDPPEGGAIDKIDKLAGIIQAKFKADNTVDVSRQLSYIAHYVGDLWTPEYLIKQNTAPDQQFTQDTEIVVFFEGYTTPIDNLHDYFTKRAQWRWKIESSKQISTLLYSEAVNDIARTWLTLWSQAGHPVEPVKSAAIVHKRGALNVNFERLLLDEGTSWDMYNVQGDWVDKSASHYDEMNRLSETVAPSDDAVAAQAQLRSQQTMLSKLTPESPFVMIETSLKNLGSESYLVTRIRNRSKGEIASLSLLYPGIKGPVAQCQNLKPGQVVLLQASLPANATKEQIQVVFATAN